MTSIELVFVDSHIEFGGYVLLLTLDTFWRTNDFLAAIVVGLIMFVLYLWGLIIVASYALKGKLKSPTIFFVPIEKRKKFRE